MADKIPSAEKMLAFLADASPEQIRKVAAATWDADESLFGGDFCPKRRESAARFLGTAWDRKSQYWKARFSDDEALKWLLSLGAVDRAWTRTQKKRRRHPQSPVKQEPMDFWRETVEARLSRWASRVIAEGRQSRVDMPLGRHWLESRANDVPVQWRWLHGVASTLHDYLYTDSAEELIRERQAIRRMHADAINGLRALEAFMGTEFSRRFEVHAFWSAHRAKPDHIRRMAFEAISNVDFDAFYPAKRHDATTAERLLVASLSDLHCEMFKTPKPEAIAEIMTLPFIKNPLDMRGIERLCAKRREGKKAVDRAILHARDRYMSARQKIA
jgi:hypothetical protein